MATKFKVGDHVQWGNYDGKVLAVNETGTQLKVQDSTTFLHWLCVSPGWVDIHTQGVTLVERPEPRLPGRRTWVRGPSWFGLCKLGVIGYLAVKLNAWDRLMILVKSLGW